MSEPDEKAIKEAAARLGGECIMEDGTLKVVFQDPIDALGEARRRRECASKS